MNIQSYVLPVWKKAVSNHEMDADIKGKFTTVGESMAEYLDRFMMRSMPKNWYQGWTKYHFALNSHYLVIDLHKVIATYFEEFIESYRAGGKDELSIPTSQINRIKLMEERYDKILKDKEVDLNVIRGEIKKGRRKAEKKKRTPKKETSSSRLPKKEVAVVPSTHEFDHDYVYKKWMEMVESKPISKSYWHIHNYLSVYILEFAKKDTSDGIVTRKVIDDFLADYGKNKRPKTMNHYNRVVYRFWEFYQTLVTQDKDEMQVW